MPREKWYWVYILASKSRRLYIGVTGFLETRIVQHKSGEIEGFTKRYNITRLVHCERFKYVRDAIARETELKKWRREKKVALIERSNPTWEDLAADWGKSIKQIPRSARNDNQVTGARNEKQILRFARNDSQVTESGDEKQIPRCARNDNQATESGNEKQILRFARNDNQVTESGNEKQIPRCARNDKSMSVAPGNA